MYAELCIMSEIALQGRRMPVILFEIFRGFAKRSGGKRGQVAAVVRTIGLNWTKLFLFFELIRKF